jgi:methyltransferase (TIGR00027 family)
MSKWRNSTTANWIAAARARESGRADALFVDPYAEALAGAEGFAMLERQERASGVSAFIPVRTRFVDDLVRSAVAGGTRQVVLLGAGLDTRAFRLGLPAEVRWFELDRAEVFEAKEPKLAELEAHATCHRRIVLGDFHGGEWAERLARAGFDPGAAVLWVAEGLFFYLTEADVRGVLRGAAEMTRGGGRFFADVTGTGVLGLPVMASYLEFLKSQGLPGPYCTDDPRGLLEACGWEMERVTGPGEEDASYGRFKEVRSGGDDRMRTHMVVGRQGAGAAV